MFLRQQHFNHHGTIGFDIWRQFYGLPYFLRTAFVPILYHHDIYICWKSYTNETSFWNCDLVVAGCAPSIEPAGWQEFEIKWNPEKILRPTKCWYSWVCENINMKDGSTDIIFYISAYFLTEFRCRDNHGLPLCCPWKYQVCKITRLTKQVIKWRVRESSVLCL